MFKVTTILLLHLLAIQAVAQNPPNYQQPQKSGELGYNILNGDIYHFTLKVILDCSNLTNPLGYLYINNLDNPLVLSQPYEWSFDSMSSKVKVVDPCIVFPNPPCYRVNYYHTDVRLEYNHAGYSVYYQDCCRDAFQNLQTTFNASQYPINRLESEWNCKDPMPPPWFPCEGFVGNSIAYSISIPSRFKLDNTAPSFNTNSDTILYACTDVPFSHTFSADDADGDSLVYSFVAPEIWYVTGLGRFETKQTTGNIGHATYKGPVYDVANPLGDGVTIDSRTGNISGSIHDTGTYMVTIGVKEYRNGKLVVSAPHVRDAIIKIFDCSKLDVPHAKLPPLVNNCNSLTVQLPNSSTPYRPDLTYDNRSYLWDLGDGTTSTEWRPVHTYDTGTYALRFITMPGYRCADTAYTKLLVYPTLQASFSIAGNSCAGQPIKFTNTSTTTLGKINGLTWMFTNLKDSTSFTSVLSAPTYTFTVPNQTYSAVLDITTTKGCEAKDTQYINIWKSPLPLQVHDTVLTAGIPYQLYADAGNVDSAATYLWTPATGLNDPFIANPIATNSSDITYRVQVKNSYGCSLTDTVHLVYYKGPDIYIPSAFTPNGDGRNDKLIPFPVGIQKLDYFRVFDRWGKLVYQTQTYLEGWDGTINGRLAPAGTYVYEASGKEYTGKSMVKKGYVVLMR